MTNVYECDICGVISEEREQLCEPRQMADKGHFCQMAPVRGKLCAPMGAEHNYVCGSCGRKAVKEALLCNPSVPW